MDDTALREEAKRRSAFQSSLLAHGANTPVVGSFASLRQCDPASNLQRFAAPERGTFTGLGRPDGQPNCLGLISVDDASSSSRLLRVEPCAQAGHGKYELSANGELRSGSSCATASAHAPVELAELVHVFSKPPQKGGALEVVVHHQHHSPISNIEIALAWLGVPDASEWEVQVFRRNEQVWAADGNVRGDQHLLISRHLPPYEPVAYFLKPINRRSGRSVQAQQEEAKLMPTVAWRRQE